MRTLVSMMVLFVISGCSPAEVGGGDSSLPAPGPAEPAPAEPAPADPAPTDPAPTDPAPTDPAPTDPAPTDPAPTDPAPTDPAPTDPAPEPTYAHGPWGEWSECLQNARTRERPCLRDDGQTVGCQLCGGGCAEGEGCGVDEVMQSSEDLLVRKAYCRVLGHSADAAGQVYWVAELQQGFTVHKLVHSLAISDEFRASFVTNKTNGAVIDALYDAVLARAPDAAGKAFCLGLLTAGLDYGEVVEVLVNSAEYFNNFGTDTVPGDGRPGCN